VMKGTMSKGSLNILYHIILVMCDVLFVFRYVMLNGKQRLMMRSDTELPTFTPDRPEPGSKISIPPLAFGFFVFPDVNVKICDT